MMETKLTKLEQIEWEGIDKGAKITAIDRTRGLPTLAIKKGIGTTKIFCRCSYCNDMNSKTIIGKTAPKVLVKCKRCNTIMEIKTKQ